MAYTDEQKRQHILELQAYLHGISHQSQLPHLIPDGVYGENTANAVRLFQQQNQLPARPTPPPGMPLHRHTDRKCVQPYCISGCSPLASLPMPQATRAAPSL